MSLQSIKSNFIVQATAFVNKNKYAIITFNYN